ncbi:hypothetical protein HY572_04695 [Candidatus Micrarchaeota archaeon]|nr:hypothetical protein [Candidatus Micrarchaeota archaeon]
MKIKFGEFHPFDSKPKSRSYDKWFGAQADWHKIPKYVGLALALLYLLGKI